MPRRGDRGRVDFDGARAHRWAGGGRAAEDAPAGVVGQGRELQKWEVLVKKIKNKIGNNNRYI